MRADLKRRKLLFKAKTAADREEMNSITRR